MKLIISGIQLLFEFYADFITTEKEKDRILSHIY